MVAEELEGALRSIVERAVDAEEEGSASVLSILAGRLADDLRSLQLLSLAGYAHQVASLGATAYEVAFILAYVGIDASRAQIWREHENPNKLPWKRSDMVREAVGIAFPEDSAALGKQEVYYKFLCWFKHANPAALKRFSPSATPLRHALNADPVIASSESHRARLLLSLRAPLVALVSFVHRDIASHEKSLRVLRAAEFYFAAESELFSRA